MPCGYCGISGHSVTTCPERLEEYHGLPSDNEEDEDDCEVAADGGATWADLTGFQRDCLEAIARLERDDETCYGLAIKRKLEPDHGEVNHGRLYPNLNELADKGLIEISELDRRTNEYVLTDSGRALLYQRVERLADACEMALPLADGGEVDRA